MAAKKAVAKADQVPAHIRQDSNRGSENVESQDVQIPRISVLQDLSPQIKKDKPEFIPGAEVATIFNVLTGELYPEGLEFVPVYFEKDHLVWKTRKAGGGLIRRCDSAEEAAELAATNEVYEYIESPNHVCILLKDGMPDCEVSIPMAVGKAKVSRKLNSLVRLNGGDRFSRVYKLSVVPDEGQGGEYYNFAVDNVGWADEAAFGAAEKLYESITGGKARRTDYSDEKTTDDEKEY
jgi:hypothetical protein